MKSIIAVRLPAQNVLHAEFDIKHEAKELVLFVPAAEKAIVCNLYNADTRRSLNLYTWKRI